MVQAPGHQRCRKRQFFINRPQAVKRKLGSKKVLDAGYGSVLVTDRYSEISLMLPTGVVYGLGDHPISFNQVISVACTMKVLQS
jgi:hypothetical protein